jgi:Arc/MetJ-type ribon-helix-helix transcriptional regulator
MRISITLPDGMLKEADAAAKKLRVSRSRLIQIALREFLKRRRDDEITRRLNKSFAEHPPEVDPFVQHLALEAMKRIEWKE